MLTRLLAVTTLLTLLAAEPEPPGDRPVEEIYQDFRNKRPLLASFRLVGPDVEGEVREEDAGLRITLPAARPGHWPTEVAANFPLPGDFEATGTYELLAGRRPAKGYGVGVHMNLADNEDRTKFAKVTRVFMPAEGSVHLTQHWHSGKDYQVRSKKTDAMAGQLRLTRVGTSLRYLVSDGPGQKFREIWYQPEFGAENMAHFRFGVSDSGEPGNPVDARLVDLRIRMGPVSEDGAFDPAPLPDPAPLQDPDPSPVAHRTGPWLVVVIALGLMVALLATVLVVWRRAGVRPGPGRR